MEKSIVVSATRAFFFFFLFSLVGAGVCVEERQGWCHELAIPVLSPYDEEINRWKKLSN